MGGGTARFCGLTWKICRASGSGVGPIWQGVDMPPWVLTGILIVDPKPQVGELVHNGLLKKQPSSQTSKCHQITWFLGKTRRTFLPCHTGRISQQYWSPADNQELGACSIRAVHTECISQWTDCHPDPILDGRSQSHWSRAFRSQRCPPEQWSSVEAPGLWYFRRKLVACPVETEQPHQLGTFGLFLPESFHTAIGKIFPYSPEWRVRM